MNNPRFIDQYNKIVGAYLRDELRPMDCTACFVGNLMNGSDLWEMYPVECSIEQANGFYTEKDIYNLEQIFMGWAKEYTSADRIDRVGYYPDYEDRLYRAMERALLYLRQLHESKGEVIDGYEFRKRELQTI